MSEGQISQLPINDIPVNTSEVLANAHHSVMYKGKYFRVTRMFDHDGNVVSNPFHAVGCVAYFAGLAQPWFLIQVDPGEITADFINNTRGTPHAWEPN
jgi:hypothetical protein